MWQAPQRCVLHVATTVPTLARSTNMHCLCVGRAAKCNAALASRQRRFRLRPRSPALSSARADLTRVDRARTHNYDVNHAGAQELATMGSSSSKWKRDHVAKPPSWAPGESSLTDIATTRAAAQPRPQWTRAKQNACEIRNAKQSCTTRTRHATSLTIHAL